MAAANQASAVVGGDATKGWGSRLARFWNSDFCYSFRHAPMAVIAFTALMLCMVFGIFAPLLAPYDPHDLATINVMDSLIPPALAPGGSWEHILGTDAQGRDLLSAILYGLRSSLFIATSSVIFALFVGIALGLVSGFFGGVVDAIIMRVIDVMLSFPSLLVALLVTGIVTALVPQGWMGALQAYVLIFAIGFSSWPKFARTVRAGVLVQRNKEFVLAAEIMGVSATRIILKHILPNVLSSLLVIATLTFGLAILDEATLSFLGVGLPPTHPSLGTLIRLGNDTIYSGEWWIAVFPTIMLVTLVLGVNLFGDWLRDAINPRLR